MTTPKAAGKDRYGERVYRIPRRDTGELVERPGITRVMKVAAAPALETWKMKMVATGLANRPDLVALAVTDPYGASKQAIDAGKAAANSGTALHAVSELVDAGVDPSTLPEVVRSPMETYARACAEMGMVVIEREVTVGRDDHLYAGTADHIVTLSNVPTISGTVVADLKTGKSVYPDTALQLAAIANAQWIFDADDQAHRDMPEVRTDVGLVIHLTEKGCRFIPLDLTGAWEVFCGLLDAWWWQQRKGIVGKPLTATTDAVDDPFDGVAAPIATAGLADPITVERLKARISVLEPSVVEALAAAWPEGVPTIKTGGLTPDHVAAIEAVCVRVEAAHRAPFPPYSEPYPTPGEPVAPVVRSPKVATDDPRIAVLQARVAALPEFWQGVVIDGAKAKDVPAFASGRATEADLALVSDLLDGAECGAAEEAGTALSA